MGKSHEPQFYTKELFRGYWILKEKTDEITMQLNMTSEQWMKKISGKKIGCQYIE